MSTWKKKLQNLPNTHKGTASGLCDSVCLLLVLTGYLLCMAFKQNIELTWVVFSVIIAKISGSILFYYWADAVKKLSQK